MDSEASMNNLINQESNFNDVKFKNLMLYIISKVGTNPNFGKTVFYKLLYFCDFDFYEKHHSSITGETYTKLDLGPAPSNFISSVKQLIRNEKIIETKVGEQFRYSVLVEPDLSCFSALEIINADIVIQKLSHMNAKQISAYSHGDNPWIATELGKVIDYDLVFYRADVYSVLNS